MPYSEASATARSIAWYAFVQPIPRLPFHRSIAPNDISFAGSAHGATTPFSIYETKRGKRFSPCE